MRITFIILFIFLARLLSAQEKYRETAFYLSLQKITQSGSSGFNYTDKNGLTAPLDITSTDGPGPGLGVYYKLVTLYQRYFLSFGFAGSKQYLWAVFPERDSYFLQISDYGRTIDVSRFALSVPLEAGYLVLKSKKGEKFAFATFALEPEYSFKRTVEGETTGLKTFIDKYMLNKPFRVIPSFQLRLKSKEVGVFYKFSFNRSDYGKSTVLLTSHEIGMILTP